MYLADELKNRTPSGRIPEIFSEKFYRPLLGFSVRILGEKTMEDIENLLDLSSR